MQATTEGLVLRAWYDQVQKYPMHPMVPDYIDNTD